MNQILFSKFNQEIEREENKKKKRILIIFKYQFIISILIILLCSAYYMYNLYTTKQKESLSRQLLSNYNINLLYSSDSNYEASITESQNQDEEPFIIGLIEIKKLKIIYPILSDVSDDLLKIAACRFYGPLPNEIGNLCIAAHNYHDYRFFSRINLLEIGDSINIYDASGNALEYKVTAKYTIDAYDHECINQKTNGEKHITLLTCNNVAGSRTVVKATAIS